MPSRSTAARSDRAFEFGGETGYLRSLMSVAEGAARGAAWNVATTLVTRGAGLVGTLVLTRFISQRELGEVSAASICVLTATTLTNLRFGQYLIAKKGTPDVAYNAMVAHVAIGFVALALVVLLRNPLGVFFEAPSMAALIPGFALTAFIERIAYIPERTLVRELRFRPLSLARSAGELTYTAVSLATAPFLGALGVVLGNVCRSIVVTTMTIRAARWEDYGVRAPLRWSTIREMMSYSAPLAVGAIADFAAGRWDNLLITRYFGPRQLGMYNLAYNLAETPSGAVGDQLGDVLFPSFAKLEPERREAGLVRATAMMGLLVFPLAVGLGSVSPTIVAVFFDERWREVGPMLAILSVLSVARSMSWPMVSFMATQHRQRAIMGLSLFKVAVLIGGIMVFARFGPLWTCVGVGFTFLLDTLLVLVLLKAFDGVNLVRLLGGVFRVCLACAAMAGGVVATRMGLAKVGFGPSWFSLGIEIVIGAVVYVAAAFVVAREISFDFLSLVKRVIARKRGGAAAEE